VDADADAGVDVGVCSCSCSCSLQKIFFLKNSIDKEIYLTLDSIFFSKGIIFLTQRW
jgi:hypothetical protein